MLEDGVPTNPEGQRVQGILDEMIRVTDGLLEEHVSIDTILEYLNERISELTDIDKDRVLVFSILEIIKESWFRRRGSQ